MAPPSTHIHRLLIVCTAALGAGLSTVLLVMHYGSPGAAAFERLCTAASAAFDCGSVNRSPYAELFSIPLAAYGLCYFLWIMGMAAFTPDDHETGPRSPMAGLLALGALASLAALAPLIALSALALRQWCLYCVAVWGVTILVAALVFLFIGSLLSHDGSISTIPATIITVTRRIRGRAAIRTLSLVAVTTGLLCAAVVLGAHSLDTGRRLALLRQSGEREFKLLKSFYKKKTVALRVDDRLLIEGDPQAIVVITEIIDFNCPVCREALAKTRAVVQRHHRTAKLLVKSFPLDGACNPYVRENRGGTACLASLAAIALRDHGHYARFIATAMAGSDPLTPGAVRSIVRGIGADEQRVVRRIHEHATTQALKDDIIEFTKFARHGVPVTLVNGRVLGEGIISEDILELVVFMEAARLKFR